MRIAVYDTKPYDRDYLSKAAGDNGLELEFHESRLTSATARTAHDVEAVCVFVQDRLDAACLETLAGQGVKMVALRCAGFNNVDLAAAKKHGIAVTRVPAYSPHAVAEHTIALLLTLNRRIHRAYSRVRDQNFSLAGLVGFDLTGKTVGVMGTGKIGKIVATIFRGFGCNVMCYDAFPDAAWAKSIGASFHTLNEVLERADIVTLHLPLMPETHHLIDEKALNRMKPGAYIVNTGRGKLIDTAALIAALKSGRLGGVALDVYEEEEGVFFEDLSGAPLQDDVLARLLTFPNVLVTAHQAFLTHEALSEIARVTLANLKAHALKAAFLEGTSLA